MNRVMSVLLIVPTLFLALLYLFFVDTVKHMQDRANDLHLKIVSNYASDSAIEEMLEVADLGTDYVEWGRFNTAPEVALNDFIDTFLLSYGLPLSEETRDLVKVNYMVTFTVAGYDGYYVYDHRKVSDEESRKLTCSPKIPYLYKDTSKSDREVTYALSMGNKCFKLTNASLSYVNTPLAKSQTLSIINTRISDDLINRVDKYYERDGGWLRSIYIPSGLTSISKTNPIDGPTVLALLDNVDLYGISKLNAFGIGGAKATTARPVSAYQRQNANGEYVKYYCYSDLLPASIANDQSVIENIYMSLDDAAHDGYFYDLMYMNP